MLCMVRLVFQRQAKLAAGVLLLHGAGDAGERAGRGLPGGGIILLFAAFAARRSLDFADVVADRHCAVSCGRRALVHRGAARQSGFLPHIFPQHNLERFSSNLYHHPQPFWFYVPVALLALVPWTVFALAALVDAMRDWRFSVQQPAGQEDFRTYLSLWFLLPIVFFSLSHSKLPGYILPGIPAATILLADFIRRREQEQIKPRDVDGGAACAAFLRDANRGVRRAVQTAEAANVTQR